jgi:hypothetical protein
METQEQLEVCIKQWIKLDNEINKLKAFIAEKKALQRSLTDNLTETMKTNDFNKVNTNDGSLRFKRVTNRAPIGKKQLKAALLSFYDNNEESAAKVSQFILEQQKVTVTETIDRRIKATRAT